MKLFRVGFLESDGTIGVNPGGWGCRDTPILGWEGLEGGVAGGCGGVVDGSLNIIISYHVQEVCSKGVNFQAK